MLKKYIRIEYLFIFLTIIWPAIGGRIGIDEAGRMSDMLMIASWVSMLLQKSFLIKTLRSPIAISMGLWMLYVLLQFTFMHSPSLDKDIFVHYFGLLKVFTIMIIVQWEIYKGRFPRLLNLLALSYAIYSILAFLFIGTTVTFENRTTLNYINDPNDISFAICLAWYLLLIKYFRRKYPLPLLIAASLVSVFIIIRLGCRTAFLEMLMIGTALGLIIIKRTRYKLAFIIAAITTIVVFLVIGDTFLESTMIGQRLAVTTEQIDFNTGTVLDYFGDRGPFYYFGFLEFLKSPIWGIGLKNFGEKNVYHELACHSEYMVNLAETGIVGAVLFLSFIICLFVCMMKTSRKIVSFDRVLLWLCVYIPLMIALFFWTYDRSYIFVMYGMVGGYYLRSRFARRHVILTKKIDAHLCRRSV